LRVPCIIEWPAVIKRAVVETPCSTLDIAPTIIDLLDLPGDSLLAPVDGESISPIFMGAEMPERRSIPIAMWDKGALIDHEFKFVRDGKSEYLFNLKEDSREQQNLSKSQPKQHAKMRKQLDRFLNSIKDSQAGKDYPNGLNTPRRDVQWRDHPQYADHLDQFIESLKASQTP
jgi:arylsulfatase A-like enzyme